MYIYTFKTNTRHITRFSKRFNERKRLLLLELLCFLSLQLYEDGEIRITANVLASFWLNSIRSK